MSANGPRVHNLLFDDNSLLMYKANESESAEILECLKVYGDASGQRINLQKSSVIFGSQVLNESKEQIKQILGIEKEGGEGTYLGLPKCFKGFQERAAEFH